MNLSIPQSAAFHGQRLAERVGMFRDPEAWHHAVQTAGDVYQRSKLIRSVVGRLCSHDDSGLEQELWGQPYLNPLGLAAGFSKEATGLRLWQELGFGYLVLGGVTGEAQTGNPKPRIWRAPDGESVVNNMGLPGSGVDAIVEKLYRDGRRGLKPTVPLWVNLCNSKSTPIDQKADEMAMMIRKLFDFVDVFELNFSCPNQAGVSEMQSNRELLKAIIKAAQKANEETARAQPDREKKPIVVKVGPMGSGDLSEETLKMIVEVCSELGVDGITATNTSRDHDIVTDVSGASIGGQSGARIHERSVQTVERISELLGNGSDIVVIGVGGVGAGKTQSQIIQSGRDMMEVGGDRGNVRLLQMYTGLVQGGTIMAPTLVKMGLQQG